MTPADQFRDAISAAGLTPPDAIEADGKLRRFASNGKKTDDSGWYVLHDAGIPAGAFGCWRSGVTETWRADIGRKLTPAEDRAHRERVEAMRREREAEVARRHAEARDTAARIWKSATPAGDHAYLKAKGVKARGVRFHDGRLVVPMRDASGELHSLQFIGADGEKRFLTGGRVTGCYFGIGKPDSVLCIAEGFATGASIHQATGHAVGVAFNAGNLEAVARALRGKYLDARLILCADDDANTPGNPGLSKAREAAKVAGALLAVPDFGADRPEGATDFNDLHRERGAEAVKVAIDAAINVEVAANYPRIWLDDIETTLTNDDHVKGVIGKGAHVLIYGPTGDGKTFFVLDLLAHVACDIEYRGRRVRQCLVVYVAAEAGASILRRFFAWRERHLSDNRQGRMPLVIITRGANLLNVADVEALMMDLRAIAAEAGLPLGIVAFDTFSRSTPGGDENAAVDVTRAIAAADLIRDELGATSAFVHHSGKDVARGARGHSSLFAAADTVISVIERVAIIEKSRDGVSGEQFAFDLEVVNLGEDQDGDPITTCVVRHLERGAPGRRPPSALSGVARVALQALQEAVGDHGETMPSTSTIPHGVRAVTIEQWRAQFRLRYGTDNGGDERDRTAIKMAFRRAREQLAKAEAVGVSDPYVWVTQ